MTTLLPYTSTSISSQRASSVAPSHTSTTASEAQHKCKTPLLAIKRSCYRSGTLSLASHGYTCVKFGCLDSRKMARARASDRNPTCIVKKKSPCFHFDSEVVWTQHEAIWDYYCRIVFDISSSIIPMLTAENKHIEDTSTNTTKINKYTSSDFFFLFISSI